MLFAVFNRKLSQKTKTTFYELLNRLNDDFAFFDKSKSYVYRSQKTGDLIKST